MLLGFATSFHMPQYNIGLFSDYVLSSHILVLFICATFAWHEAWWLYSIMKSDGYTASLEVMRTLKV